MLLCGNDNDLSLLKDKVDFGMKNLWRVNIPRLDKTWRLNQVRLGYKKQMVKKTSGVILYSCNAKDGNNTRWLQVPLQKVLLWMRWVNIHFLLFKAAEPAFKGANGWRAVPILVGTGGSFDKGQDAENFFYNPEQITF
jgi:hypothetical protein